MELCCEHCKGVWTKILLTKTNYAPTLFRSIRDWFLELLKKLLKIVIFMDRKEFKL